MQNVHVLSRPVFNVISNGALVFAVSLILWTGKWIQLFTETFACIQPAFSPFSHFSAPFEKNIEFWSRNIIMILTFTQFKKTLTYTEIQI